MTQTEALRLVLEALEELNETNSYWWQEVDEVTTKKIDPAITAIKAALEANDEPVATKNNDGVTLHLGWDYLPVGTKLYAIPPQRKPLTNEAIWLEYQRLWPFHPSEEPTLAKDIAKFARAIEAVHGIKGENT